MCPVYTKTLVYTTARDVFSFGLMMLLLILGTADVHTAKEAAKKLIAGGRAQVGSLFDSSIAAD